VPVQELMKLIFDVKLMKQVMMEFEVSMQTSILILLNILMINGRRQNVAHSTSQELKKNFEKTLILQDTNFFFMLELVLCDAYFEVEGNCLRHLCEIMSVELQAKKNGLNSWQRQALYAVKFLQQLPCSVQTSGILCVFHYNQYHIVNKL